MGRRGGRYRSPTLCQRQEKMQSTYTIPGGFPQDTVDINQMEHFSNHFVGSFTSVADNGISMMMFFNAILVHAKACGPNGKQRRNELTRDAEGIIVALAKFEETCAELRRVDDGICTKAGESAKDQVWTGLKGRRCMWKRRKKGEEKNSGWSFGMRPGDRVGAVKRPPSSSIDLP